MRPVTTGCARPTKTSFVRAVRNVFADPPNTTAECADELWRILQSMGHDASGNECRRIVDFVRAWQPALARQGF